MKSKRGFSQVVIFIILAVIFGFALSQFINGNNFIFSTKQIPETEQGIVEDCENLNLKKTAGCFVANVKTFYKYKETEDSINLTFDELKEKGGDCRNYDFFYVGLGNKLGFESNTIGLPLKGLSHRIAILSDGKDYCMLDQTTYWCKDLEDGK